MATKNSSNKTYKTELKGFFGIDRSSHLGDEGCDQIQNFRLDPSGALIKRPGRKKLMDFSYPVSSAISFPVTVGNRPQTDLLVAAPPYVHAVGLKNGEDIIVYSDAGEPSSRADLVVFQLDAYLFDGFGVKVYDKQSNQMKSSRGYAPLYGKNWHPIERGEIFEKPNLLCGDLRINYTVSEAAEALELGFLPSSVSRVEIDGELTSEYTVEKSRICGKFPENSRVDVWLTRSFENGPLFFCRNARAVGGGNGERIIAFGNPDRPSFVFCSSPVTHGELELSRRGFSESSPLYFPESLSTDLGGRTVTSVCSCGDSAMIFTDTSSILAEFDAGSIELFTLSDSVGCVAPSASISKQRSVYTFSKSGIYRFDVDLSAPYDSELEKLSSVLEGGSDLFIDESCSVFDNETDGELWFACAKTVFIYNLKFKRFYSYTGMQGVAMIDRASSLLFFESDSLWEFSNEYYSDISDGESSRIIANLRSRWLDFGDISVKKHSLTVYPVFKIHGGDYLMLGVQTDSELVFEEAVFGDESLSPDQRRIRVARCRFNCFRINITSYDDSRPQIFGAVFTAQS